MSASCPHYQSKAAGVLGNHRVVGAFGGLHGFFPSRGAQTPFAAGLEPDAAQVVAARGGEVEEFAGYLGCVSLFLADTNAFGERNDLGADCGETGEGRGMDVLMEDRARMLQRGGTLPATA